MVGRTHQQTSSYIECLGMTLSERLLNHPSQRLKVYVYTWKMSQQVTYKWVLKFVSKSSERVVHQVPNSRYISARTGKFTFSHGAQQRHPPTICLQARFQPHTKVKVSWDANGLHLIGPAMDIISGRLHRHEKKEKHIKETKNGLICLKETK